MAITINTVLHKLSNHANIGSTYVGDGYTIKDLRNDLMQIQEDIDRHVPYGGDVNDYLVYQSTRDLHGDSLEDHFPYAGEMSSEDI